MADQQTVRAVYERDGLVESTGDLRLTLDVDSSTGVEERESGGLVAHLPDGTNVPLRRNIYRSEPKARESRYVIEVETGTVHTAEAATEGGSEAVASDPITAMAMAGERAGLVEYYQSVPGIGEKKAESLADAALDRIGA